VEGISFLWGIRRGKGDVRRGKQTGGHCQGERGSRIIITQALSRLRTTCGSLEWRSCSQPVITRAKALWVWVAK
jgi:hypothetical protein